jgi:uncharacterized protein YbjQ (UPF0145 family)
MPIFANKPPGDAAAWEPQAADGRLAHTAGADPSGVFTSDLSVSEYVLLGEAGFEPLGFVVGSSIYHIGLQAGKWSQNQELQILTQAMYSARELAMARMQAEADHLGADGIVGVQLRMQNYAWGQGVLEFIATGTAVRALGDGGTGTAGVHRAPDGRAETAQAGSAGIVGVTVEVNNHVWGEHATEFLATGTAIRRLGMSTGSPRPHRSPPSRWGSTARPRGVQVTRR